VARDSDQIGAGVTGNETTREIGGTMGVAISARSSPHFSGRPFAVCLSRFEVPGSPFIN
jgi:hypothetical protein